MAEEQKAIISTSTNVERESFSWHLDGRDILHPVRDQRACRCCYAITAVAVCEAIFNLDNNLENRSKVILAPQEIVDCIHEKIDHSKKVMENLDSAGCRTSSTNKALKYIVENSISLEKDYPFEAKRGSCNPPKNASRLQMKNFTKIATNATPEYIRRLIDVHPIAGVIDAYDELITVKNEIYQGPAENSPKRGKHAILVIGYGIEGETQFYWIQNSWGLTWGMDGYGRIRQDLLYCFSYAGKMMLKEGATKT